jgi:hypothetical protein
MNLLARVFRNRSGTEKQRFGWYFVSHTLVDTDYCRSIVLPSIDRAVGPQVNAHLFMNLKNFGQGSAGDGSNQELFAKAYSVEIERLLDDCRYFLLVASPDALRSAWVRREVTWWFQHRSATEAFIVFRAACDTTVLHRKMAACSSYSPCSSSAEDLLQLSAALQSFQSR